jgi:hypothetical protein
MLMSDERPFFTLIAEPNGTGMNDLLAEAKASEVKYKDRCKMHVLASPEVGWTPRRIGRYLKRYPRTLRKALHKLGMHRALAITKSFLIVDTKTARMTFYSFVSDWDILD